MGVILKIENISKQYRLGLVGTGTISHDLNRFWAKIRGKEDPYLKIGAVNDRTTKASEDYVWALQDINFEVQEGEVLGIIGKNGAGKSTLLKILSRVTSPTTGVIKTKGRIASLLEVGTGFHPELTGRENIFLNGAILGMTKAEINSKIEEIVEFSGCELYIDTPVKRYSSGMRVRLAFAVAAHLEPDILIVDEVLAVGDAEFQKKAIGKMQDISKGEGRTVLFVSHNMASVQSLCTRCIVLKDGIMSFDGEVERGINEYLKVFGKKSEKNVFPIFGKNIEIVDFKIINEANDTVSNLILGKDYKIHLLIKNKVKEKKINVRYQLFDSKDILITTINTFHTSDSAKVGIEEQTSINCILNNFSLAPGQYRFGINIIDLLEKKVILEDEYFSKLYVENGDFFKTGKLPSVENLGKVMLQFNWVIE